MRRIIRQIIRKIKIAAELFAIDRDLPFEIAKGLIQDCRRAYGRGSIPVADIIVATRRVTLDAECGHGNRVCRHVINDTVLVISIIPYGKVTAAHTVANDDAWTCR